MDIFKKRRLTFWAFVALVIANLALLATIWLPRIKSSPRFQDVHPGDQRLMVRHFLERELAFTPEQVDRFYRLREEHFERADALKKRSHDLRKQLMDHLFLDNPDGEAVDKLTRELGTCLGDLESLTFRHFQDLINLCEPGQKEKFQGLLYRLLELLKPREHRPPPGPERLHRPPPRSPMERDRGPGNRF